MQSCFLFLCIQWRMSLHLPFLSTSKNHVSNVLQSCQSKTVFLCFFFNVTCIKILTHIFPHLYFLCISYVLQVYHCLFQKTTTSIFLLHSSSSRELYQWHWLPRGSVFRRLLCSLWTRHVHMWGARNRWYVSKYIILAYNKSHSRNISGIESWANCIYILSIIWCSSI